MILGTLSHLNSLTRCGFQPLEAPEAPEEASASSQCSQLSGRTCNTSAGGKSLGEHGDKEGLPGVGDLPQVLEVTLGPDTPRVRSTRPWSLRLLSAAGVAVR